MRLFNIYREGNGAAYHLVHRYLGELTKVMGEDLGRLAIGIIKGTVFGDEMRAGVKGAYKGVLIRSARRCSFDVDLAHQKFDTFGLNKLCRELCLILYQGKVSYDVCKGGVEELKKRVLSDRLHL